MVLVKEMLKNKKMRCILESRAKARLARGHQYTRILLYVEMGDVRRCDARAFRANLLSVLYGSVLIEV